MMNGRGDLEKEDILNLLVRNTLLILQEYFGEVDPCSVSYIVLGGFINELFIYF